MREIDADTLAALNGSRAGDKLIAYGWYNGQAISEEPLPITRWALGWDLTRQIQTCSLQVDDESGKFAPWLLEDPLGVGGSLIQLVYEVGGTNSLINMGWYRITNSKPAEMWRRYVVDNLGQLNSGLSLPKNKRLILAPGGATISLSAADLAIQIKNDRFIAPSSPVGVLPTVIGEITRLLADIVPVVVAPGVTDELASKRLIYETERLDAVEDLCAQIGCTYRMNGDGQFEIYPLDETTPVWTLRGGDEGVLIDVSREQNLEGLYNVFVAEGSTTDRQPVRGIARVETGPLRVDGPHGNYPVFYSSPLITTQEQATAYANKMRDTQLRGLTTDLQIQCLPNPALQQGDWVTVASPVVNGQTATLNGKVKRMDLSSNGTTIAEMSLTVECSYSDVQTAIGAVNRG